LFFAFSDRSYCDLSFKKILWSLAAFLFLKFAAKETRKVLKTLLQTPWHQMKVQIHLISLSLLQVTIQYFSLKHFSVVAQLLQKGTWYCEHITTFPKGFKVAIHTKHSSLIPNYCQLKFYPFKVVFVSICHRCSSVYGDIKFSFNE